MTLQRRSLRSAPAVLNTADKAVWVTGWNEAVDALEAEQAANSRIASLYEELRKAIDEGSESMTHDDALKQIAYWQNKDEQAQAVEPVGVFDMAVTEKMAVIDYDCTKHSLKSGDKLYTHPAPPATTTRPLTQSEKSDLLAAGVTGECVRVLAFNDRPATGERCATDVDYLIGRLRRPEKYFRHQEHVTAALVEDCAKAADMLEADGKPKNFLRLRGQLEQEWAEVRALKEASKSKAQQVAVPPGYALAMAVLQSSLYQFLDDVERSECDALIAAAQGAKQ